MDRTDYYDWDPLELNDELELEIDFEFERGMQPTIEVNDSDQSDRQMEWLEGYFDALEEFSEE